MCPEVTAKLNAGADAFRKENVQSDASQQRRFNVNGREYHVGDKVLVFNGKTTEIAGPKNTSHADYENLDAQARQSGLKGISIVKDPVDRTFLFVPAGNEGNYKKVEEGEVPWKSNLPQEQATTVKRAPPAIPVSQLPSQEQDTYTINRQDFTSNEIETAVRNILPASELYAAQIIVYDQKQKEQFNNFMDGPSKPNEGFHGHMGALVKKINTNKPLSKDLAEFMAEVRNSSNNPPDPALLRRKDELAKAVFETFEEATVSSAKKTGLR